MCWVIVVMRRRGASRGRPVWWFAASSAFVRRCAPARGNEAVNGVREPTQSAALHDGTGTLPNRTNLEVYMKMVKSLMLGTAAGLVAMTGAQAADLPVKAKAVEYVKICSLYGAGFYYIPGTDMCLKIGGWVRFEAAYGGNGNLTTGPFNGNANNRGTSNTAWRSRGYITADS